MFEPPRRSSATDGPGRLLLGVAEIGRVRRPEDGQAARLAELDGRPPGDGVAVRDPGIVAFVDVHDQLEGRGQAPLLGQLEVRGKTSRLSTSRGRWIWETISMPWLGVLLQGGLVDACVLLRMSLTSANDPRGRWQQTAEPARRRNRGRSPSPRPRGARRR